MQSLFIFLDFGYKRAVYARINRIYCSVDIDRRAHQQSAAGRKEERGFQLKRQETKRKKNSEKST
jgi:hypothetical protein